MENMKKYYKWLILVVVMALNFGCAQQAMKEGPPITWENAEYIENSNTLKFGADFNSAKIVLDKSFVPSGNFSLGEDADTPWSWVGLSRYVFIDVSAGRDNVNRTIVIYQYQITDRRRCFVSDSTFETNKKFFAKGKMKLYGIDVAYIVRQIPCTSKGDSRIIQSCTYAMSIRLAVKLSHQRIIEIQFVEGSDTKRGIEDVSPFLDKLKGVIDIKMKRISVDHRKCN